MSAVREAALVLRERHNLKPDQDDDFRIFNSAEFMAMLSSTSVIMTNLLLISTLPKRLLWVTDRQAFRLDRANAREIR